MTQPVPETRLSSSVTIRGERPGDGAPIVHIWYVCNPDLSRTTVEEYHGFVASMPKGNPLYRLVAERDGRVVAVGRAIQKFWVASPGSADVSINVRPEQRGQGIGSALYNRLEDAARDFGAERLFTEVRENQPDGLRFARKRGFEPTDHVSRLSRLEVSAARDESYDVLEERLREQGVTVKSLAQLGPDDIDVLREWHRVDMETAQDEPAAEAYDVSFEVWRDSIMKQPGVSPDSAFAALLGGRIIGVTKVQRAGEDAGWHAGMGVRRDFRGRGVARLLKWRSIQWARSNGIRYLYTGNDKHNPRMYSINERLGYVPLPGMVELVRSL
ncbi:MAG TPA: GNAT family N-acetyltransferase [Chloroflexota bacterium]